MKKQAFSAHPIVQGPSIELAFAAVKKTQRFVCGLMITFDDQRWETVNLKRIAEHVVYRATREHLWRVVLKVHDQQDILGSLKLSKPFAVYKLCRGVQNEWETTLCLWAFRFTLKKSHEKKNAWHGNFSQKQILKTKIQLNLTTKVSNESIFSLFFLILSLIRKIQTFEK